jgi:hypothetical protein
MLSDWLYAEVLIADGASAPLDPDQEERAILQALLLRGDDVCAVAGSRIEGSSLLGEFTRLEIGHICMSAEE